MDDSDFLRNVPLPWTDRVEMRRSMEVHRKTPEIDLATYRDVRRAECAHMVRGSFRIYLDTSYWIWLRDVELGNPKSPKHGELHKLLSELTSDGRIACPLSYSSVHEMLRVGDKEKRIVMARIMDRFGHGVCLQMPPNLLSLEVENFFYRSLTPDRLLHTVFDLAWTRPGFYVGEPTPHMDGLPAAALLNLQKTMHDAMFALSAQDMAEYMADRSTDDECKRQEAELAKFLSSEKAKPANLHGSYEGFLQSEIWGIVEAEQETLSEAMHNVSRSYGFVGEITDAEREASGDQLRRFIGTAYQLGKLGNELPQIFIGASLHAGARLDPKRKMKANDFEDFRHAGSALPYCNAFFTERSLAHLIRQPPLELDQQFDCTVCGNVSEAIELLERLASET